MNEAKDWLLQQKIFSNLEFPLVSTQTGDRHIFERGCLRAGEEWIETNLVPVAAVNVAVMVLQVSNQHLEHEQ